jgi:cyclopropane fatty-acyl-phospholipid synthase-like methyltransferase
MAQTQTHQTQRIERLSLPTFRFRGRDRDRDLSERLRALLEERMEALPWRVVIRDWTGAGYGVGGEQVHWSREPLTVTVKNESAGRALLALDAFRFLEHFLEGNVDLDGNLYVLPDIRRAGVFPMRLLRGLWTLLRNTRFQNQRRARSNVKSHYDIPQEAIDLYLDRAYLSYSCAIFEQPYLLDRGELVQVGSGKCDSFDSLERAQWRKFQDAMDFISPEPSDTLLDIGCGYGGQLRVALEGSRLGKVVGWTHSANQTRVGAANLEAFDSSRWELHEGDYRQETRVFDHVTSVGMVSHVGPRGLVPYVRNVRARIRTGGRYLHHALMTPYDPKPHDLHVGYAFNKQYMWPGFHWFTLGDHTRALERSGFEIERGVNLSAHYAKTTAAWYERMLAHREEMVGLVGESAFRAKQVFLAGISGSFSSREVHVYRLYCRAV